MNKTGIFSALAMTCVLGVGSAGAAASETARQQPTAAQIQQEVDQNLQFLGGHTLKKAKALLEYYGDFAPFGAALMPSGDVKFVWAIRPGEDTAGINPALVLESVRTALQAQAANGRILGSAVIYKYLPTGSGQSAEPQVNIELEYLNGEARVLATKYQKSDDGYAYGDAVRGEFESIVFASQPSSPAAATGTSQGG
ncbi:hypothetical protein [Marinobacter sp. SS21]|uniref:hypothetical protein n=1 Tax=Marinobacter sp. SS21 TaxID=2979460 RepID=UPI00232E351F|nr:hypothetical protein [Marinobacter sp. SS21]MDC0661893.1 hypothetical protein [Marinobacter sp. SS21]